MFSINQKLFLCISYVPEQMYSHSLLSSTCSLSHLVVSRVQVDQQEAVLRARLQAGLLQALDFTYIPEQHTCSLSHQVVSRVQVDKQETLLRPCLQAGLLQPLTYINEHCTCSLPHLVVSRVQVDQQEAVLRSRLQAGLL